MNKNKSLVLLVGIVLIALCQLNLGATDLSINDQHLIENLEFFENYELLEDEDHLNFELINLDE